MIKVEEYYCEKCNEEFLSKSECEQHEKDCQSTYIFKCDKCGKEIEYTNDYKNDDIWLYFNSNECHHVELGSPGYGSKLDSCEIDFNICDDCLHDFVSTFTWEGQEKIFNSGCNRYVSSEDWIRVNKGEEIPKVHD